MSFRSTYILFGILLVVLVVFGLVLWMGPTGGGESDYVLPSLHDPRRPVNAADITTVEIDRHRPKEEKLVFVRDKEHNTWRMTQPYELRVDRFLIDRLVGQVFDARRFERADLTPDLKEWGLDPPAETITLKEGAEREWTLNLGNERPGTANAVVYVTSSDRLKDPEAVQRAELDTLFKGLNDYRSKDLLAESALNITSVKLQEGKSEVVLDKSSEGHWRFEKPPFGPADEDGAPTPPNLPAERAPKPITGVRDLLSGIESIRVESAADFVAEGVTDLAKYGLEPDKPARLRIEIKKRPGGMLGGDEKKEPVTEALLVGKKTDTGDKYYACLEGEHAIVQIPAKNIDAIAKIVQDPAVLRNRDLVQVEPWKVDAINIKNAAGQIELRKPDNAWKLFEGGKARPADMPSVTALVTTLTGKRLVQSFPESAHEAEFGFDKPEAVVSLWENGITKDEKKDAQPAGDEDKKDVKKDPNAPPKVKSDQPAVKLTFGKKDGGNIYVRRESGADKMLLAVPESLLTPLTRGPLAYLERSLPSFSAGADVTGLILHRGGEVFDIEKEPKDKQTGWKLKAPKEVAGRAADTLTVERILNQLRGLRPERLVAEKPTPAALDEYGLKTPALQATVKVKDKDGKKIDDWVYQFGKETEDKSGRFAKLSQSDLVFVVPRALTETFDGELRDRSVFRLEARRIRNLKLVGWKQALSFTSTLELDRKPDGNWTVKPPADFDLDSAKATALANDLANLQAMRFVGRKSDLKPQYQLGPAERLLQIEVTLEGDKQPRTLTLGALDTKEKGYYAESSTLAGDIFLVPQDRFEKWLTGPKSLSRGTVSTK